VVLGKYEIKGTMAFGGLGWIYLALDTVLSRWVVLKGLLNSKDPNLLAVAVKEREFLAAVKNPSIVGIYDFITQGREGYIVMEYVSGKTLMTLRKERGGPLPAAEAASYILDILPAFSYLAEHGLVYCDFKPENAMVEGDAVKLIDMGAVRRLDDPGGDIYGSRGYSAPEASNDPSPVSDLYTVARTLAVLVANFDFQGRYEHALPPSSEVQAFQEHESLYRFLLKATRAEPEGRFQDAQEMAGQLVGVLREIVAETAAAEVSAVRSTSFDEEGDLGAGGGPLGANTLSYRDLPPLMIDSQDPGQAVAIAAAVLQDPARRRELFERGLATYSDSLELRLRFAGALTDCGAFDEAQTQLAQVQAADSSDWRSGWYRARLLLAQGKAREAAAAFEAVFNELPGELAPKLGLAMACEVGGEIARAIHYYDLISISNPAMASAAFGLARCRQRQRDRDAAAEAYQRVPGSSSQQARAQMGLALALLSPEPAAPGEGELGRAAEAIESLRATLDSLELHEVSARILETAAESIETGAVRSTDGSRLLGVPMLAKDLRQMAEDELRACARFAKEAADKIRYIDEANRVRPRTLV